MVKEAKLKAHDKTVQLISLGWKEKITSLRDVDEKDLGVDFQDLGEGIVQLLLAGVDPDFILGCDLVKITKMSA